MIGVTGAVVPLAITDVARAVIANRAADVAALTAWTAAGVDATVLRVAVVADGADASRLRRIDRNPLADKLGVVRVDRVDQPIGITLMRPV